MNSFSPCPLSSYNSKIHPSFDKLPLSSTATLVGNDFDSDTKTGFDDKTNQQKFRTSTSSASDSDAAASDTDNTSIDDEADPRTLLEKRWNASPDVSLPYPKKTWASPILEIVACILWTSLPVLCFVAICLSYAYLWYPFMAYVIWICYDFSVPFTGGANRGRWFVRMPIWGYYRSYFSNRTVLTPEAAAPGAFECHEKLIFGYSPHGMYCLGAFASFCLPRRSDCPFPNDMLLTTLGMGFFVPFFRELLYAYGFIAVGKHSIMAALNKVELKEDGKPKQKAILICVGGAREALWSTPGKLQLVLKKRKGFTKIAIRTGAALVPVLSFGENNVYHQVSNPPGSLLRTLQEIVLRFLGFSPVIFRGDTILGFLIPRRKSLVTVVGAPIPSGPIDQDPSAQRLDELHALYMKSIQQIWDDYKDIYATDRTAEMQFVG